jgi:hypothetical protein
LYESRLPDVGAQPAGVFQVFVVGVLRIAKAQDQAFQIVALEDPGIQLKRRTGRFASSQNLSSRRRCRQPST